MKETISFTLNDKAVSVEWVLRTDLGLTGTKYGCGKALCGACTVIMDGMAVRSCVIPVSSVKDRNILTIEGLAKNGKLHPIQEAFAKHDSSQQRQGQEYSHHRGPGQERQAASDPGGLRKTRRPRTAWL